MMLCIGKWWVFYSITWINVIMEVRNRNARQDQRQNNLGDHNSGVNFSTGGHKRMLRWYGHVMRKKVFI